MRINEDYLDDIELTDEIDGNTVSANSDEIFNHKFIVSTGEIIKRKPLEFYLNGLMKYRKTFNMFLERSRFIDDFNPDFIFRISWREKRTNYTLNDGTVVAMPEGCPLEEMRYNRNTIIFVIDLAVRIDSLEQIRRILLYLWKAMEISLKASFGSGTLPLVIRACDKGEHPKGECSINKSIINAWTSRSAANEKMFLSAYRYYHQDIQPK